MAASTTELSTETPVILTALRQELKAWETSFAAAHEGRKAGREDIKQHSDIEEKYKQYNKLRHPSQQPPASKTATPTKKRHCSTLSNPPPSYHTPSKRLKSNHSTHDSIIATYDPPTSTGVQTTPSKRSSTQDRESEPASTGKRRHKSPLSASNQTYLNTFLTPSANRILNSHTSSSRNGVSKFRFDETPAFLRRDSQRAYTGKENETLEEDISWSPVVVRKLPKPAGRGLSALVKGLRDMEDEKLDEELEMLREMEGDYAPSSNAVQPKILVDDSQRPDMPLGPDGGGDSDDSEIEEEGRGRDGRPLKTWKKKGQKRTTRRVLMKPNVAKWKPEPAWKGEAESEDDGHQAVVEEIQAAMQGPKGDEDDYEDELATDHELEESNNRKSKTKGKSGEKEEGFAAKVRKKISATAHANFRALKIKNKQSKGKSAGRFGRRR
ncbi:hypothetical protein ABVK25_002180 [Lepraria finkii]|uniref:DNA replication regulator SLD2 n=1 Tax=Lepraria finkii TaxID=1340010 RepID=A0ABR4BLS3_9LECA